ncbi:MAG: hypothetical protein HND48_07950 [Chloroflexi bacterium]|nr:hypothetical protein [Chloroflexota bacterium]
MALLEFTDSQIGQRLLALLNLDSFLAQRVVIIRVRCGRCEGIIMAGDVT